MPRLKTKADFINKARSKHGDKYDYSLSEYKGSKNKLKIICSIHGEFYQTPSNHYKYGCSKCSSEYIGSLLKLSATDMKTKCIDTFGDTYDYSNTIFKKTKDDIVVRCKTHGYFSVKYENHITLKNGCRACSLDQFGNNLLNLYIAECFNSSLEFLKVGVSSHIEDIGNRVKYIKGFKVRRVYQNILNPKIALQIENDIKSKFNTLNVAADFSGFTECYSLCRKKEILELILKRTTELSDLNFILTLKK